MSFTIALKLRRVEGGLQRLIGLVRRRGYEVTDLVAHQTPDGEAIDVTLTLESDRPSDVLARQVAKLFEVQSVVLTTTK